jgi:hypothetical protein
LDHRDHGFAGRDEESSCTQSHGTPRASPLCVCERVCVCVCV